MEKNNSPEFIKNCTCRACGFIEMGEFWENGEIPSFGICSSCGCEAGNEDFDLEDTRKYRQKWINAGMKWYFTGKGINPEPENWDPIKQMENIPPEWR